MTRCASAGRSVACYLLVDEWSGYSTPASMSWCWVAVSGARFYVGDDDRLSTSVRARPQNLGVTEPVIFRAAGD
ncbi:hypothetical protein KCP73_12050 [Salmonella enterica subsp. enterica]|nr:hypothetical protein KCP73_12050 [Salmonella enterica subsp. enterica]